jgi:hypothetical protein
LLIVFFENPVSLTVDLMLQPSTSALTITVRSAVLSLFIMTIMLER